MFPGSPSLVHAHLYNFDTGKHDLKPEHRRWLKVHLAPVLRHGGAMFLKGMASRIGKAAYNQWLSSQRIKEIVRFLESQVGLFAYAPVAYGESRSTGGVDDDEWHRGVELGIAGLRPPPPPPPPKRKRFDLPDPDLHEFEIKLDLLTVNKVVQFVYSYGQGNFRIRDLTDDTEAAFTLAGKATALIGLPVAVIVGNGWNALGKLNASLADFEGQAIWQHWGKLDGLKQPPARFADMPKLTISSPHLPHDVEVAKVKVVGPFQPGYVSIQGDFKQMFPIPRKPKRLFAKP
ncbi:MAG TPA: hypothetical protein VJ890_18455 [Vineibacter sp.]|nr:hypothetical protein [Vineibacter sp.]